MGTPYFNRDESIILTAHKVNFDSATSDVMLTSQRLILIDAGYAQFKPLTISLATIETVIPGEDAYGNPIITLSLAATIPGGATQSKDLVFSQKMRGERKQECNDWVKRLKEQVTAFRQKASPAVETPTDLDTDIIFDDTITTGTDHGHDGSVPPRISPAPQEPVVIPPQKGNWRGEALPHNATHEELASGRSGAESAMELPPKIPLSSRFHPAPASPDKPNFTAIAAIIIVILAVAGGVFMYSHIPQGTPPELPATITPLPITTIATPVPTTIVPEQTPTPPVTPLPTTQPEVIIPDTGVWVRVQYAGNFTGLVGISGGMQQINGSVDQFYRIPTIDDLIEATIQKQDGSGNVLTVEIYKNGKMVKRSTIASPMGILDLHVDLKKV